jgi:hypothetical protein
MDKLKSFATPVGTYASVFRMSSDGKFVVFKYSFEPMMLWHRAPEKIEPLATTVVFTHASDDSGLLALSDDGQIAAFAAPRRGTVMLVHLPDGRILGTLSGLLHAQLTDLQFTSGGALMAFTSTGILHTWEADGNGIAWPWSSELVSITHQPVDDSSVEILRQAQVMRHRGWLSNQESKLLDLALHLMENRLNLDIEIDWTETYLPSDDCNIEIVEDADSDT